MKNYFGLEFRNFMNLDIKGQLLPVTRNAIQQDPTYNPKTAESSNDVNVPSKTHEMCLFFSFIYQEKIHESFTLF